MWLGWSAGRSEASTCGGDQTCSISQGLALLHQSLVLTQGLMEGEEFWGAIALPHGLSMVPFLPMIPQSTLPSLSPQLVSQIRFVPNTPGKTSGCGRVHLSNPGATSLELSLPTTWAGHSTFG